jgi:hypothetical protein
VGDGSARLLELRAVDDNPLLPALDNTEKEVRVGLTVGRLRAVSLGIGDVPRDGQVFFLAHLHVVLEPFMVVRPAVVRPVHLEGDRPQGVDHRPRDAASAETAAGVTHHGPL